MYPCEGCLVDVVCIDPCDELIFFSDNLNTTNIPYETIKTANRLERVSNCVLKYGSGGSDRRVKLNWKFFQMRKNPPDWGVFKNG